MASGRALQVAVAKAIKIVGPMARTSYLRTSILGGSADELIGQGMAYTNYDMLFNPQPVFHQLGKRKAMYLSTESLQLVGDDYKFIFPTTELDVEAFEDPRVTLLLVDGNGMEKFRILYIDPAQFRGIDVAFNVFARSIGHLTTPDLNIEPVP